MTEARLRVAVGSLSLVGAALASYLLYIRWTGSALACTTGGCETVQASSYSKVLGVPVALLGLIAYVTIFAMSLFRNDVARVGSVSVALAGVGFAAYLLYLQLAVINAVCEWCLASDAVVTVLAALTLLRLRAAD
ncbi:MAG: hypothetical protein QOH23_430 [Gaiellaceae bacterium]|nr:hypothetical protein [Gaiellaceae bacterium]